VIEIETPLGHHLPCRRITPATMAGAFSLNFWCPMP
jgi:hypothetical protein